MSGHELEYIKDAFENNWIAPGGNNADLFEKEIGKLTGASDVAALSSGTAAIHLALKLAGVKRDDEVIVQSFTYVATANPVVYLGAKPVFVDSEKETWNMCPQALEDAIKDGIKRNKKPAAVIPVHLYGMPANISEIIRVCEKYEIPVIEDAAEAIGASVNGVHAGISGDFGVFSFNGNKIITTSGGGALVARNDKYVKKARFLATQAKDPAFHYEHTEIGYNYRMSNILAGIGLGQLKVLKERIERRREIFETYKKELQPFGLHFLNEPEGYKSNRWLTTALFLAEPSGESFREYFISELEKENIESRPLWKPMHMQPVYAGSRFFGGDAAEKLFETGVCLPSGSNLSDIDLKRVIRVAQKVLNVL